MSINTNEQKFSGLAALIVEIAKRQYAELHGKKNPGKDNPSGGDNAQKPHVKKDKALRKRSSDDSRNNGVARKPKAKARKASRVASDGGKQ
jgi:hypothetical protein